MPRPRPPSASHAGRVRNIAPLRIGHVGPAVVAALALAPELLADLSAALEPAVARALRGLRVDLEFVRTRRNGSVQPLEGDAVRIRHRTTIQRFGVRTGAYRIDATGVLEPGAAPSP